MLTSVLERLHADGRLGAYWWCWTDYPDELRARAPFDEAPYELSFRALRADSTENRSRRRWPRSPASSGQSQAE